MSSSKRPSKEKPQSETPTPPIPSFDQPISHLRFTTTAVCFRIFHNDQRTTTTTPPLPLPDPDFNPFDFLSQPEFVQQTQTQPETVVSDSEPEFVIETQPTRAATKRKEKAEARCWEPLEALVLAQSWIDISEDATVGKDQKHDRFWIRVLHSGGGSAVSVAPLPPALPPGYDTQVGDKGSQLSGGQKQRIALARVMIKDPKILLLDEPTSALDSNSESLVQHAIDNISKGRTTIVIAHRLATVRNADMIVVLEQGSVVEIGDHNQLMTREGAYFSLIKLASEAVSMSPVAEKGEMGIINHEASGTYDLLKSNHVNEISLSGYMKSAQEANQVETEKVSSYGISQVWKLQKSEANLLFVGVIFGILAGAILSLFPLVLGQALKVYFNPEKSKLKRDVGYLCLALIGLGFGCILTMTIQQGFCGLAGTKLTKRVRDVLFRSILKQEPGWFDSDQNSTGILISRLSVDCISFRSVLGDRYYVIFMGLSSAAVGLRASTSVQCGELAIHAT
ncbi:unnamed protein product [Lactuca virosa]|uniref:ABC transmembrane type-1 domain-containing protein n=1 Tax=Lactuca virosa TaxID=75947 RepID=A0AAU9NWV7_9ASTR|nr:unnamed protein product [Lactuca virosa]